MCTQTRITLQYTQIRLEAHKECVGTCRVNPEPLDIPAGSTRPWIGGSGELGHCTGCGGYTYTCIDMQRAQELTLNLSAGGAQSHRQSSEAGKPTDASDKRTYTGQFKLFKGTWKYVRMYQKL